MSTLEIIIAFLSGMLGGFVVCILITFIREIFICSKNDDARRNK